MRRVVCLAALVLALVPAYASAQGGPPMITDDPDTPGPGYWEINLATFLQRTRQGHTIESPRIDINYGVGRRIQLKYEVPWLRQALTGEARQSGAGDSAAGVKWRFLGQEGQRIAWSIYPQVAFNTEQASVTRGLVEAGRHLLLPTELTLEIRHAEINVELGRDFAQRGSSAWVYGLSTEGHVMPRLELLVELHAERADVEPAALIANAGLRQKLTRQLILMVAAGRAVRGDSQTRPDLLLYTGLQFNLPGLYSFKDLGASPRQGTRR